jgi:hypothetical protein
VLTIRAMTGGESYAQRHLQQSDYYDQNRGVKGQWHGRGAELVGLKGECSSDDHLDATGNEKLQITLSMQEPLLAR